MSTEHAALKGLSLAWGLPGPPGTGRAPRKSDSSVWEVREGFSRASTFPVGAPRGTVQSHQDPEQCCAPEALQILTLAGEENATGVRCGQLGRARAGGPSARQRAVIHTGHRGPRRGLEPGVASAVCIRQASTAVSRAH